MFWLECKIPSLTIVVLAGIPNSGLTAYSAALFEPPWALISALGILSGILGIGGMLACIHRGTTIHPWNPHESEVLVASDVYRFTRNPMYLGLMPYLLPTIFCNQPRLVRLDCWVYCGISLAFR